MSSRQIPRQKRSTKKPLRRFDPKTFLATAGIGKMLREYAPKQVVFCQGEPANAVFYVRSGRVRRSRVNFFMNRFRKLGLIDYNDGLIVNSSLLDVVLHES